MQWKEGEYWLRDAVKHVKFPPDRRKVREELYEHMLSRNLEFLAEDHSEEEADRLACLAMGDPEEVGRALAEVHKPFWGYFLRALRILFAVVFLLGLVHTLRNWGFTNFTGSVSLYRSHLELWEAHTTGWIGQESVQRCGDYRFRLKRAAVCSYPEDSRYFREGDYLVLELQASTWDPRLGLPDYASMEAAVEDSRGNRYAVISQISEEFIFSGSVLVIVRDFDPAAEWAALTLTAGERELRFPVKLKEAAA